MSLSENREVNGGSFFGALAIAGKVIALGGAVGLCIVAGAFFCWGVAALVDRCTR